MSKVRVRFAPSPTGPLHIGGVRTALYNYLFAKRNEGSFILRIEDTDQNRYVEGAESYIEEALEWLGLSFDESPSKGGDFGPYRQSERKSTYKQYAEKLIELGKAYYAFDTPEDLQAARDENPNFKYGSDTRSSMKNALTLDQGQIDALQDSKNTVVRLKFPEEGTISFQDEIRGEVKFDMKELDDKVILKADGMPTYHLANIVDDHLMKITHVIRGEEWLSSTAHHVFMYESLEWECPTFAHLPLILKPSGKGKLSKRDGAKFGIPVFPLEWNAGDEIYPGFRESGFLPDALINFLAFLGWSPKTDEEMFSIDQLIQAFTLENIVKSGARFDIDKANWYNQQYIIARPNEVLAEDIKNQASNLDPNLTFDQLTSIVRMMKERVDKVENILIDGYYLYQKPTSFDEKMLRKKLKEDNIPFLKQIADLVLEYSTAEEVSKSVKSFISENNLKMGEILPVLRIALTGTMKGPDLFETIEFLGGEESKSRIIEILSHKTS